MCAPGSQAVHPGQGSSLLRSLREASGHLGWGQAVDHQTCASSMGTRCSTAFRGDSETSPGTHHSRAAPFGCGLWLGTPLRCLAALVGHEALLGTRLCSTVSLCEPRRETTENIKMGFRPCWWLNGASVMVLWMFALPDSTVQLYLS